MQVSQIIEQNAESVEKAGIAAELARCPDREGPFGGYDYGHNPEFYGPPPEKGRYVIRDFRFVNSRGEWLHQTNDREQHERMFEKMTREHIARAAITVFLEGLYKKGMVVVPREATEAMQEAFWNWSGESHSMKSRVMRDGRTVYRAMMDAATAPSTPAVPPAPEPSESQS